MNEFYKAKFRQDLADVIERIGILRLCQETQDYRRVEKEIIAALRGWGGYEE